MQVMVIFLFRKHLFRISSGCPRWCSVWNWSVDVTVSNSTFEGMCCFFSLRFWWFNCFDQWRVSTITNSSFSNGSTGSKGGAIHIDHGQSTAWSQLSITDSTFKTLRVRGGDLCQRPNRHHHYSSTFESNCQQRRVLFLQWDRK